MKTLLQSSDTTSSTLIYALYRFSRREIGAEIIFEETTAENFPNQGKQTSRSRKHGVPNKMNT